MIWCVVLAVAAIVLNNVPLFNLLGFDYSFVIGLFAAFAGVDIGHGVVAAARRADRQPTVMRLALTAGAAALAPLCLPLLLSAANALRVKNCNLSSGLAFYALLPVATALYAAPWGVAAALCFPRRGRACAFAIPVASLLWSLSRLYYDPAVFAMDPFGGYFPGPIYDEALTPPLRFLHYRLVNLVWMAAVLAVAGLMTYPDKGALERPGRARILGAVTVLLVVLGFGLFLARGRLGFAIRHDDVLRALPRRSESAHFVLHAAPASVSGESAADIDLVHRDLEFRHHQLARILGVEPSGKTIVYRFPSAAAKKDVVGAATTLYAKPWTREIFLQADRFPATKLRHELAHVFAGSFGDPIFGVALAWRWLGPLPVPRLASGLIEGVAEAADATDPAGRFTIHQEARSLVAGGTAPALAQVVGAGFTTLSGARAYTMAGSFCAYLLETFGAERLRTLYRTGGDFPAVYGRPLAALDADWRAFLERQPRDPGEGERAKETFRRPAIFQKVCARELAARVAEARAYVASEPERAVSVLESVCRDDPAEPSFALDLADATSAAGQSDRALALLARLDRNPAMTAPLRARAANLAAAIHFQAGRHADAEAATRRSLALATDDGEERTALAKLRGLRDAGSRVTLGRMMFGDAPNRAIDPALALYLAMEFERQSPAETLAAYLVGRQLSWRDPGLALAKLERACPTGAPPTGGGEDLPAPFARECRRMIGELAYRSGALEQSRAAFEYLRINAVTQTDKLKSADFLDRIAWQAQRPTPAPSRNP